MLFPHGETVTILTGTAAADPYSGEAGDLNWDDPAEQDVEGCGVQPRTSVEPSQDARTAVIVGLTVFMPAGTVIGPHNRLRVRGDDYEVEGEPGEWISPFTGWAAGVEVAVKRVSG